MFWRSERTADTFRLLSPTPEEDDEVFFDSVNATPNSMETIKTQYLPSIVTSETRSFEVQSASRRKVTPSTPQRQRPNSSGKLLELTPLWEQVVRYNRFPQNVEKVKVFSELSVRLTDPEWEVRQHALRVLVDLIPVMAGNTNNNNNDLDSLMIPVVLSEVTYNLGHSAPAVRKSAFDVMNVYLQHSSDPEFVLRSIVTQGLESPAANKNLTMAIIMCLPSLLKNTLQSESSNDNNQVDSGGCIDSGVAVLSHQSLVHIVTALSKKLVQTTFQQHAVSSMAKIREQVGASRFDHFLESYYPQMKRDFDVLCKVYDVKSPTPTSNLGDSGIDLQSVHSPGKEEEIIDNDEDDWSDGSPTQHSSSNAPSSTSTNASDRPAVQYEHNRPTIDNDESIDNDDKLFSKSSSNFLQERINNEHHIISPSATVKETDYGNSDESDASVNQDIPSSSNSEDEIKENNNNNRQPRDLDSVFGEATGGVIGPEQNGDEDEDDDEDDDEEFGEPDRVVMETEIKFDSETAITMTILEENDDKTVGDIDIHDNSKTNDNDNSVKEIAPAASPRYTNDFVMKVLEDDDDDVAVANDDVDDENGVKKTPRRVRFGGEVVKLRTPDSDVTIEIREESEENVNTEEENKKEDVIGMEQLSVFGKESVLYERRRAGLTSEEDATSPRRGRPRSSHIPVPVAPALHRPQEPWRKQRVDKERQRRRQKPLIVEVDTQDPTIPTCDGGDSLTSGSEGEPTPPVRIATGKEAHDTNEEWKRLAFIDPSVLDSLLRKDDWRSRVRGLDRLAAALRQPEISRYVATTRSGALSLLMFLTRSLYDDRSQRVVCSTLRALRTLFKAVPAHDLVPELAGVVPALCRHIGGGASVAVKLEAVEAVKTLMRTVKPAPVVEVLFSDKCFESRSSKLRENALLCLMYALMTFPSTEFNCTRLAQRVIRSAVGEQKRRVRQSILDTLAVLAQFVPRSHMKLDFAELPTAQHDDAMFFLEALHARLVRRTLPTVSPEGLILYGVQIPPVPSGDYFQLNFGPFSVQYRIHCATDLGVDVEWIMAGSGSLSCGSAKSRTQLDNAQRSFVSPPQNDSNSAISSYSSWGSSDMVVSGVAVPNGKYRVQPNNTYHYTSLEDIKAGYDGVGGWVNDPRQNHPSLSYGTARPLYIKLHNENDNNYNDKAFPKLHVNTRRQMETQGKLNQTWPVPKNSSSPNKLGSRRLAILEPLENQYDYYSSSSTGYSSNSYYNNSDVMSAPPHVSINPSSLPPLVHNYDWRSTYRHTPTDEPYQQYDSQKGLPYEDYRQNRWTRRQEPDLAIRQRLAERENGVLQQKPILARQNKYGSPIAVVSNGSLQTISSSPSSTPQTQPKVSPTSLSPHLSPKPVSLPSSRRSSLSPSRSEDVIDDVTVRSITPLPDKDDNEPKNEVQELEEVVQEEEIQTVAEDDQQLYLKNEKLQQSAVQREERQQDEDHIEVKSISEHEEEVLTPKHDQQKREVQMDTLSVEEERLPTPPPPLAVNELLIEELKNHDERVAEAEQETPEPKKKIQCKILGKPRTRLKRSTLRDHKGDNNSSLYPLTLQPFDNPKETLNKCLFQLDNPDWEITMQGLQGVVRLSRHHAGTLLTSVHPVCVAVTKHIRSLRSQVSRAACQAAAELFASLGRAMEPDVDDMAGALLSRSADTNKFLRSDCNATLDVMVNTISPVKSVSVICNKGAKHQNAVVRTAACRLLVKLCERVGAERTLNMPRDCRDSVLITGARFLTEGSLDTRRYAKEMFAILSRDNRLPIVLHEVVPGSIMRSISKVLAKLTTK